MVRRFTLLLTLMAMLGACAPAPAAQSPTVAPDSIVAPTVSGTVQPAAPTAATDSLFPVTIAHKYGETTIPAAPERVVALGYTDQDPILALGVVPVAVRYYFGDTEDQVWPWADGAAGGVSPEVLNIPFGELNAEAIAALQPDLIIAVSSGITDADYATLSQIAPTLAQSADYVDFGVPWQEQTRVIGRALGKETQAEELLAATEARFAELRAAHPEFTGATAAIAAPAADGQFFFSGPEHERQRVLTALGFTLPEELASIAGDSFYGTISGERLDLLDTDVLIVTASPSERATIEANPIFQQLDVVKAGRVIYLDTSGTTDDRVGPALVYSSVLSLPVVFDELVPRLAAALGSGTTPAAAAPQIDQTIFTREPSVSVVSSDGTTRAVAHARGETVIPAEAERIVVLDETLADSLLALDITPVGSATYYGIEDFSAHLAPRLSPEASIGQYGSPSLERIVALRPDLILVDGYAAEELYDELSAIAPTVVFTDEYTYPLLRAVARVVGREEAAEARIAAYEAKAAEARAELQSSMAGKSVALLRVFGSELRVEGGVGYTGPVLWQALGLTPHRLVNPAKWNEKYSLELIPELDADILLLMPEIDGADTARAMQESPLWQQLPAVRSGNVYTLEGYSHWLTYGILANERAIDDVLATLGPQAAAR